MYAHVFLSPHPCVIVVLRSCSTLPSVRLSLVLGAGAGVGLLRCMFVLCRASLPSNPPAPDACVSLVLFR
ncbi:hypothetical protein VTO73DRAFT_13564 [Trametes versicolor]